MVNGMKNKVLNKFHKIFKSFGIIFLYIFLQVMLGDIFRLNLSSKNAFIYRNSLLLIYVLLFLIISLFFLPKLIKDLKSFKKEYLFIALKNWVYGFIVMIISNLYLIHFVGNIAGNEATNRTLLSSYPIQAILIMSVFAPALEEIVFRLNIKNAINNKYIFMLVSGLLFGSMHVASFSSLKELLFLIPYGSLGFFFAKTNYETDNIFPSIISHSFHNTLSILLIFLVGI